jgi:hypothetical protein
LAAAAHFHPTLRRLGILYDEMPRFPGNICETIVDIVACNLYV